jgi:hypothetical protein
MDDVGFNGTGSRFNSRFGTGSDIYAKQLNDLAAGVQSALGMPYLGGGVNVNFTAGGNVVTALPDPTITPDALVQQFQIKVTKVDGKDVVQVAKGFVIWPGYITGSTLPNVRGLLQAEVVKFWGYPTGKLTNGTTATSPWVNSGGYVEIKPGP